MVGGRVLLRLPIGFEQALQDRPPKKHWKELSRCPKDVSHRPGTLGTGENEPAPCAHPHTETTVVAVNASLRIPKALVPWRVLVV